MNKDELRNKLEIAYRANEAECVRALLEDIALTPEISQRVHTRAANLVTQLRTNDTKKLGIDQILNTYPLSSPEGLALLCLAEALQRIPDKRTRDRLIHDKMAHLNWKQYLGQSDNFLVNTSTRTLMFAEKIISAQQDQGKTLLRWFANSSEPIIRKVVEQSMKVMGRQFVMGETIEQALKRAAKEPNYRHSYDMLGEAAHTQADVERYFASYRDAIEAIGQASQGRGIIKGPGISIKLSALHARYDYAQRERVMEELVPRLLALAQLAKKFDIGLTVDAEEANRLQLSLDVMFAVFEDPSLAPWEGFGLALQSYQKRAIHLIDGLADRARAQKRKLMLRLIKGAYWDSEIKHAQQNGFEDYPVFTRKCFTDLSFMTCAKKIISMPDAFYPQFATHNAYSIAFVLEHMPKDRDYEFQRLHGMGMGLHNELLNAGLASRIYCPVGRHEDLLPYLVRRLLENGANTSFVHGLANSKISVDAIVADPIEASRIFVDRKKRLIPLPIDLFFPTRVNSMGFDLENTANLTQLSQMIDEAALYTAQPSCNDSNQGEKQEVRNPADHSQIVGHVTRAQVNDVECAITQAQAAFPAWNRKPVEERAKLLDAIAAQYEANQLELAALIVREGGRTLPDAFSEIREAVDFCRYYAEQARDKLAKPILLPGPTGEENALSYHGRGIIACISPWNFPLAIFTGQIVASLVTGNAVLAKPAEQTQLIAALAVSLMYKAGIPRDILQLLPGRGRDIGTAITSNPHVQGVMFTGSTATAQMIQNTLVARSDGRIIPLIAETGGQNAMIVDSSALLEQTVADVITSAFGSAGQRCSALRVLFLQEEIVEKFITLLKGAMAELRIGNPKDLKTDVGPLIDKKSCETLHRQLSEDTKAQLLYQLDVPANLQGSFFAPRVYQLNDLSSLTEERFGPVLHVISYKSSELEHVIDMINQTGYGLTLGIQSRIKETIEFIRHRVNVGNIYVNRSMIGAVVGVQPFGGEGLSGTGPKAGGPNYLLRLCVERVLSVNTTAAGGNAALLSLIEEP